MKIAVASDHRGFEFKEKILTQLIELRHEAFDFGSATTDLCDYPDFGLLGARAVSNGDVDRAILIGRTGIGMCIVANKVREVRAALCHDQLSAETSRRHFDANTLCLSADLLSIRLASSMIEIWLDTPFDGGLHAIRLAKISEYEQRLQESHD